MSNPYQQFLQLDIDPKKPDFYKVFDLSRKSITVEQIRSQTDKVIASVRAQKPGDNAKSWASLIDVLTRAKAALLKKHGESSGVEKTISSESKSAKTNQEVKQASPAAYSPPTAGSTSAPVTETKKGNGAKSEATQTGKKTTKPEPGKPAAAKNSVKRAKKKGDGEKAASNNLLPQAAGSKSEGKEGEENRNDDLSFKLDAPDENDSFDSDTHLSAKSFQTSSVMVPTVDPMGPIDDPTGDWDNLDVATAVATQTAPITRSTATEQNGKEPEQPESASVVAKPSNQTFYSEAYRKKSKATLMIGGFLVAILIVTGISYVAIFGFPGKGSDNNEVAQGDGEAGNASGDGKDKKKGSNTDNPNNNDPSNGKKSDPKSTDPKSTDPKSTDPKSTDPESTDPKMVDPKSSDPKSTDPKMVDPKSTDPKSTDPKSTDPKSTDPKSTDPKSTDPKSKMESPEPAKPKNSDIAELGKTLTDIRVKLQERDFVETSRLLAKAEALPKIDDHRTKYDRLKMVAGYYEKFWNKVVEGCGELRALDEIKFSDENIVKVVESSESKIIYRALGQRFEKTPRELPIGIAMKIADKGFDANEAETRIIKGVVYAIESYTNSDHLDRAKELWEEAELIGGSTDELVLYLDDTYDLIADFIEKVAVPDEDAIKEAQDRFRKNYEADITVANRNQKNATDFANKLLIDIPGLDDAADRHANFVAAQFYAGKAGDIELAMTLISEMNKWFTIDMDQETLKSLTALNKGRLKPDQKKEITRTAFEYMDRAKTAKNGELELKFAELALMAARGARAPNLVQTASDEVRRIKLAQQNPTPDE